MFQNTENYYPYTSKKLFYPLFYKHSTHRKKNKKKEIYQKTRQPPHFATHNLFPNYLITKRESGTFVYCFILFGVWGKEGLGETQNSQNNQQGMEKKPLFLLWALGTEG